MPIYEYACKECGHTLDALQKMTDDALVDCPACHAPALKRLISAPRFRLKGGGWYETDFKTDKQRNVHKADSESGKSDKPDKSEGKGEKSGKGESGKGESGKSETGKKDSTSATSTKQAGAAGD